MMTFAHRRWRNILLLIVAAVAIIIYVYLQNVSLGHSAYTTGWLLIAMCFFLAAYNLRKKMSFIPLGSSAGWLQWHIYIGLLSIVVFTLHALIKADEGFAWPNGYLEGTLAALYIIVALSGIFGLFITRIIPARLSVRGEQVLYERIPGFRRQVRDRAAELAIESVAVSDTTTIADYYQNRLAVFFERPRYFWRHLIQSTAPRHKLLEEMANLDRYLSDPEREIAVQLTELVETKDDLDYQFALQASLKCWLFVHIAGTYALLLLAVIHAIMATAFSGGIG